MLDISNTRVTELSLDYLCKKSSAFSNLGQLIAAGIHVSLPSATRILKNFHKLNKIQRGKGGDFVLFRNDVVLKLPPLGTSILVLSHPMLDSRTLRNVLLTYGCESLKEVHLKTLRLSEDDIRLLQPKVKGMQSLDRLYLNGETLI